ncbi:MAG: hypothetical protein ACTSRG_26000 [Candidatus Helarchaeota archaeon]
MDEKGYLNLYDVINEWLNIINISLLLTHNKIEQMESLIDGYKGRN